VVRPHDLAPEMYLGSAGRRGNWLVHQALVLFREALLSDGDLIITTNESHKLVQMLRDGVRKIGLRLCERAGSASAASRQSPFVAAPRGRHDYRLRGRDGNSGRTGLFAPGASPPGS